MPHRRQAVGGLCLRVTLHSGLRGMDPSLELSPVLLFFVHFYLTERLFIRYLYIKAPQCVNTSAELPAFLTFCVKTEGE